jgi:hypothetical protein
MWLARPATEGKALSGVCRALALPVYLLLSDIGNERHLLTVSCSGFTDAAKVPPSRFQKRKGSIYAVPGSRDGHVDSNYASKFHEKHSEKGYDKK